MSNINSTTSWDAELIALRDEIYAEQRQIRGDFTLRDAAQCAIAQLAQRRAAEGAAEAEALATPAARKAAYYLAGGLKIRKVGRSYLVPSATRNVVHHVSDSGACSCEAGRAGKACWHVAAVEMVRKTVQVAA